MSTQSFISNADRELIDTNAESGWWDIDQVSVVNESTNKFEYKKIIPDKHINGSALNALGGDITFTINEISQYLLPSKAFFDLKVTITKEAEGDFTSFTNPAAHVLFNEARYDIGNSNIEHINNHYPYVALVRGLLGHTRRWIETAGYEQGWALDGCNPSGSIQINYNYAAGANEAAATRVYTVGTTNYGSNLGATVPTFTNPGFLKRYMLGFPRNGERLYTADQNTAGVPTTENGGDIRGLQQLTDTYNFKIPLSEMFTFCRDIRTVFKGFTHKITLKPNSNIHEIIQTSDAANPRTTANITINELSLFMPYVVPSMEVNGKLLSYLAENKMRPLIFYPFHIQSFDVTVPAATNFTYSQVVNSVGHRPMQIYVFMTHNSTDQGGISPMTFIHNFIKHIQIRIGQDSIPVDRVEMNLEKKQAHLPYQMFKDCFGGEEDREDYSLTYQEWLRYYPIFCFDLSNYPESLFYGSKQLQVTAYYESPVVAEGFQGTRPNVQSYKMFVASTYQKVGKLQTGEEGIKFISA